MIIKLEFASFVPYNTVLMFLRNPKGTCLSSSKARNITPQKLKDNVYISFWYIDDMALKYFFGGNVTIYSLQTYPGILKVQILQFEKDITSDDINSKFTDADISELLPPFV
jgi:hypothetical protein